MLLSFTLIFDDNKHEENEIRFQSRNMEGKYLVVKGGKGKKQ